MRRRIMVLFAALFFVLSSIGPVRGEESQPESTPPKRPADFKPFQCEYTAEQLKEKFSDAQMTRAAVELQEIQAVNEKGPWKPDWASLGKHPVPEWFQDAKFGIAVNWGLYSVPAWDLRKEPGHAAASRMYPDAYPTWMYDLPSHREHHAKTWGKGFEYDDFFPLFTAENYDPEKLAALLHDVGARYVLPFASTTTGSPGGTRSGRDGTSSGWDRRRTCSRRWSRRCGKRNIKVGLYCPLEEYAQAALDADGHIRAHLAGQQYPARALVGRQSPAHQRLYSREGLFQAIHGSAAQGDDRPIRSRRDVAGRGMVRSGRGHARRRSPPTSTTAALAAKRSASTIAWASAQESRLWRFRHQRIAHLPVVQQVLEEIRSISPSYAYNYEDTQATVLSREAVWWRMLVNIVSRNGNLLLIVGPDRTGKIPDLQLDRVKRWAAGLRSTARPFTPRAFCRPMRKATFVTRAARTASPPIPSARSGRARPCVWPACALKRRRDHHARRAETAGVDRR